MITTATMPRINLDAIDLTTDERAIAERILNAGRLRASKPAIKYEVRMEPMYGKPGNPIRPHRYPDAIGGKAAYVWRMVAFTVSPKPAHHCMPCTADFDLPEEDCHARRAMTKELDVLVDRIVASVPKSEWHGITRWGQVFGLCGTPQATADGAIIYR